MAVAVIASCFGFSSLSACKPAAFVLTTRLRKCSILAISQPTKSKEELLVVVGGGAAGVYGAIHAKTVAPHLGVVIIEQGKPLTKVKVSGGGRCNVTNGHCADNMILAENYPRGHKEFRGPFFNMHGPVDTMSWFASHGVELKIEDDGRVFPVSNSSSSIIDCLMSEVKQRGVSVQTRKAVTAVSVANSGKFLLEVEQLPAHHVEHVEADYLLIASGSSRQGYALASQLGHSIVDPMPSLFTFKIEDLCLRELSGVTFPKVKVRLKLDSVQKNIPQLTQVCFVITTDQIAKTCIIFEILGWPHVSYTLGTQWPCYSSVICLGCSLSVQFRLQRCWYHLDAGRLIVDFIPDLHAGSLKSMLVQHKNHFAKQKVVNSYPPEFGISKRFWSYVLERQGVNGDILWASISNNSLMSIGSMLKDCTFEVIGKGQFKDEFVTAGGVPLSEISLNTMESKICSRLFFAGEILNVDGVTGGFNFQNAWSGGFIAGTTIGGFALSRFKVNADL